MSSIMPCLRVAVVASLVALFTLTAGSDTFAADNSAAKLEPRAGDKVVMVGGALAERLGDFGQFETLLHSRFPDKKLVVRNLGWSGDELSIRMRSAGFEEHGHELTDHKPTVILAFYGFNESFAGPAGLPKFEKDLASYIQKTLATKYDGKAPPRLVLVTPIAQEDLSGQGLSDGEKNNANLRLYAEAIKTAGQKLGVPVIDLFTPTLSGMRAAKQPWTFNGVHLNAHGDAEVAKLLDAALFGARPAKTADLVALKREVDEKNKQFHYDYRALNGCYIFGERKEPFGVVNFPAEFAKLRKMIAVRDARVWDAAAGKTLPTEIDDSQTGSFVDVKTNVNTPTPMTTPEESRAMMEIAPGYDVQLFASEREFPDLAKPVQCEFDERGRLWVMTMPSYPMYLPGTPVNDKILILEDTDGDGKADKQTVFADKLYMPTGFEIGDQGAYVAQQPNLVYLKDTDGDSRADQREVVLHGFDSADSHHAINAFTWGPDGALYFEEGTFHQTSVETPHGPQRNADAAVYRYEPRTHKFETFVSYPFANPWGHVFDRWGQNLVADASGGANYFGTAFSGQVDFPHKHGTMPQFLKMQWRPTAACELVSSKHFPDDVQGNYLLCNVIGFQGVLNYKMREEGSGFAAEPATPLVRSKDLNFRPVDIKFGPDGSLFMIDWYNPLIGHMQHSVRDPKRDQKHGRVWRITAKNRPLAKAPKIAGASTLELLDLLKSYEDRTRYRVRRALRTHDTKEVMAALEKWTAGLDKNDPDYEHHLLETLWVHQQHDVVDQKLLKRMLRSPEPRARAAATRVLCYWRDRVDNPLELLATQAGDEHPRVRLEAVRAASFFHDPRATDVALESLLHPQDQYLEYTLKETLDTLGRREAQLSPGAGKGAATLVRLLKSGKLPAAQTPTVIRLACKRGNTADLTYIFGELVRPEGLAGEARGEALSGLVDAAATRKVLPQAMPADLKRLLGDNDKAAQLAAIQLIAARKEAALDEDLTRLALAAATPDDVRRAAVEAVVSLGEKQGRALSTKLLADKRPPLRALGVASLATLDTNAAAPVAAKLLADPTMSGEIERLLAGFLARRGGAEQLATAIGEVKLPADTAKLALRMLYLSGGGDAALSAALTKAAGISQLASKLTPEQLQKLSARAMTEGDAHRGEAVFRREELGCYKCHALSGAGGDVGPDLSAIGANSPPDYMFTSLLDPDLNIKEVYVTRQFLLDDGRVYSGIVVDRDDNRVVLKDSNGKLETLAADDIENEKKGKSLMPHGLPNLMTEGELFDLVRFLSELGKPGPFAMRSQQTVQRWQALKETPAELAAPTTSPLAFRNALRAIPETAWLPFYAHVAGDVPLVELASAARPVIYLQATINVTRPGPARVEVDSPEGVQLWIDGKPVKPGQSMGLLVGARTLLMSVTPKQRSKPTVKVTVSPTQGSTVALSVLGGK